MQGMSLLIGAVVGVLAGFIIGHFLGRRSSGDLESILEKLSSTTMTKQTAHILNLAETKLSDKKDAIDGTLKRMEEMMRDVGKGNVQVGTRLNEAAKLYKELNDTASGLKSALGDNHKRGQWGERMAEDVLRLSGLIEGINFIKQTTLQAGSKPDFTFMLPQKRTLNMDVKFPFSNYQHYVEAKTEKEREEHKKEFLKDVRKRLKEVQTRDYINPEDGTVDYVLLFVPNEQIFSFINEMDRTLIDEAMHGKTILCSPLSLYAILAVIRQSMDNFSMETNSKEMLEIMATFKQQWEKFKDHMETVKQRFDSVHKGYEELTGARENQLDRQLKKLDDIRSERLIDAPIMENAVESAKAKATKKLIAVER